MTDALATILRTSNYVGNSQLIFMVMDENQFRSYTSESCVVDLYIVVHASINLSINEHLGPNKEKTFYEMM